jgi:ABC-type antimicrobial peptide transport system permease subunit
MIALALVNAAIVATLAARDSARSYAIMRTLGATPGQTAASFLCGQLTSAVLAVALGIPAGIGVFNALRRGLDAVQLSLSTVATLTFAALVAYLAIAAVPALVLARRPVAPQLAYE